ncbi:MAG: effector-associated domain EAD1-containing protein [Chloroflexota bacterium]
MCAVDQAKQQPRPDDPRTAQQGDQITVGDMQESQALAVGKKIDFQYTVNNTYQGVTPPLGEMLFDDWRPFHKQLYTTCARLYEREDEARRVSRDAFIETTLIVWTGSAQTFWSAVIHAAEKQGKVDALMAVVARDYNTNLRWQEVMRARKGDTLITELCRIIHDAHISETHLAKLYRQSLSKSVYQDMPFSAQSVFSSLFVLADTRWHPYGYGFGLCLFAYMAGKYCRMPPILSSGLSKRLMKWVGTLAKMISTRRPMYSGVVGSKVVMSRARPCRISIVLSCRCRLMTPSTQVISILAISPLTSLNATGKTHRQVSPALDHAIPKPTSMNYPTKCGSYYMTMYGAQA